MHLHILWPLHGWRKMVAQIAVIILGAQIAFGTHDAHATVQSPQMVAGSARPYPIGKATALVAVDVRHPGKQVSPDFLGFSYEAPVLADDDFNVRNKTLINLLSNLGRGSLRFGGKSVEHTAWAQTPRPKEQNERAVLTPHDLDRLFAFSKRTGWHVILGLNLGTGDAAMDADEASYAIRRGGAMLTAVEIGNEPDLYTRIFKIRPTSWGYSNFRNEFETALRAIIAREPRARISGPATADLNDDPAFVWFPRFLKDEGNRLVVATHHIYPMISDPAKPVGGQLMTPESPRYPSIPNMLSSALMDRVGEEVEGLIQATKASHLPLRIAETNSAAREGQPGVSDVFAAALWGADYAFTLVEHGADGLNFHGTFACTGYTAICRSGGTYLPRPLYYGMLLFHAATPGRIVPVTVKSLANLTGHAVLRPNGSIALVLINKDPVQGVHAAIASQGRYRRGSLWRLVGQSLDSAAGITLGDRPIAADGTWNPARKERLSGDHGSFEIDVPPQSAVLVRLDY